MQDRRASSDFPGRSARPELDQFLADVDTLLAGADLRRYAFPTWPPRRAAARRRMFPRGVFGARGAQAA